MTTDPRLHRIVAAQPYPLLFATISGAHLYGFPSPDSDFDLRGAHVLSLPQLLGLEPRDETVEDSRVIDGLEMGIHLMRTGEVEANLVTLNGEFRLPYIADLVARKLAGPEKSTLDDADVAFHKAEYERLRGELQAAHEASHLPEAPPERTRGALNDLLVRVRLQDGAG